MKQLIAFLFFIFVLPAFLICIAQSPDWQPELTETWHPVPENVVPGLQNKPPSDAIMLLKEDYKMHWTDAEKWNYSDGILTIKPGTGGITSTHAFADIQFYTEWRIPENADGEDQRRGNSGLFFQELYEVQLLDSYQNATYTNGQAGAIYKQYPPLVNASLPPGEWQSYHIIFTAPVFTEFGSLARPAFLTVFHNGVLIQNNVEVKGPTIFAGLPQYEAHPYKLPIFIQGSRHQLSFRNMWVREL